MCRIRPRQSVRSKMDCNLIWLAKMLMVLGRRLALTLLFRTNGRRQRRHRQTVELPILQPTGISHTFKASPNYTRLRMWNNELADVPAAVKLQLEAVESLLAVSDQPWPCWRSLNLQHWDLLCKDNEEEMGLH